MVMNIAIYDSCIATNEKDSKRSSAQRCISLIESLQTFSGREFSIASVFEKYSISVFFFIVSLYVAL